MSAIVQVAVPVPVFGLFDYQLPEDCISVQPGCRVRIPFGKTEKIGYVITTIENTTIADKPLKTVIEVLDSESLLAPADIDLLHWASRYYHHPLGEVFHTAFPVLLRKGKPAELAQKTVYALTAKGECVTPEQLKRSPQQQKLFSLFVAAPEGLDPTAIKQHHDNYQSVLKGLISKGLIEKRQITARPASSSPATESPLIANAEQQAVIDHIRSHLNHFQVTLLEGVTGSGKTEVYMQLIQTVIDQGRQALVLLPEITLTPQFQNRFKQRFSVPIAVFHSKMTEPQRLQAWLSMRAGHSQIMLGTRSALFTPCNNLGLLVLDEEHDSSFKQQDGLRFSARDLAIVRAKQLNIPILLGTATPSMETLFNVRMGRYQHFQLSARAGEALQPQFQLLDIRNKKLYNGLSEQLLRQIRHTLKRQEQVLLFLNRRGYAPVLICHSCSWVARCDHCDTSLVVHLAQRHLRCHHCGFQQPLPTSCPACRAQNLNPLGLGTEKIEQQLHTLFPDYGITRLDRDSTQRKGSLEQHLRDIQSGKVHIILGTQMLAKGHHFPNVTLVALLDVDAGLFSMDFHATEKLAQLIVQVAGRAGRAEKPGTVVLQTRQPDHPLLITLLQKGYPAFAETCLEERQQAQLPPYTFQALFRSYATDTQRPQFFLQEVSDLLNAANTEIQVLGPVPAPMHKKNGSFHYQLLLQSASRTVLQQLLTQHIAAIARLKSAHKVRWSIDIDPIDLY